MKKEEVVKQRILKFGRLPQKGPDTKSNWSADRRSQYNLNLELKVQVNSWGV
jgi:hypothetical protein